jgi:hypothetical protein
MPRLLDENGNPYNEEEMDIFEIARLRGAKNMNDLPELMSDEKLEQYNKQAATKSGQRHSKKDYERLKKININDIVAKVKEDSV